MDKAINQKKGAYIESNIDRILDVAEPEKDNQ